MSKEFELDPAAEWLEQRDISQNLYELYLRGKPDKDSGLRTDYYRGIIDNPYTRPIFQIMNDNQDAKKQNHYITGCECADVAYTRKCSVHPELFVDSSFVRSGVIPGCCRGCDAPLPVDSKYFYPYCAGCK